MSAVAPLSVVALRMRVTIVLVLSVLFGCVEGATGAGPDNPEISVSGNLTLKGPQPGAWWALTDSEGRVWKITSPTPEQIATFERSQNRRIKIDGRRQGKYLSFDQIQPLRVTTTP
jgi:hypothetical protein